VKQKKARDREAAGKWDVECRERRRGPHSAEARRGKRGRRAYRSFASSVSARDRLRDGLGVGARRRVMDLANPCRAE
jgi:hypothetical protein